MRLKRSIAEYYLMDIRRYQSMIHSMCGELADLRVSCGGLKGIVYDGIKVQTSGVSSPLETAYINMQGRIDKLNHDIAELVAEKSLRIDQIRSMEPCEYSQVLELIFVDGKTYIQVMDAMNIREQKFWTLRRKALNAFAEKYSNCVDKRR